MPSNVKRQKLGKSLDPFSSEYYPKLLNHKQVVKYLKDENKPINQLHQLLKPPPKTTNGKGVVHLFNNDLRLSNNTGLYNAETISKNSNKPLLGLYVHCIEELYSHSMSKFQLKFKLDSLSILKQDLENLNIPLVILTVDKKSDWFLVINDFLIGNEFYCLTNNICYEVDELRDAINLAKNLNDKISYCGFHDTCVIKPGELKTGKGTQYSVFTPWYKSWVKYLKSHDIKNYPKPLENTVKVNDELFKSSIPSIPEDFKLNDLQLKNYNRLYNPGEQEVLSKLRSFIQSSEIKNYDENRNQLDRDASSHLSHYLAIGALSTRTIVVLIFELKAITSLDSGNGSVIQWIRQVAWRDFYKHVLANWPHISMFKPFNLDYDDLAWEYNLDHFEAWCNGTTGYPVVDACMRMLNQTGYLQNRGRMIVASFLSKHLLIDWRYGERYFMEQLIDGDLASNNGGWGFSSSTGVDPQPYFRIFNPWIQSTKFDPNGDFIKAWVPELNKLDKKAIHNPYEVLSDPGIDYPKPIVEHKFARERALQRYNEARY